LANEFFQQEQQSPIASPFQQSPVICRPLLFQQQQETPIASPLLQHHEDWTREFGRHQHSQPATPYYDEFEHIYERHLSKSPMNQLSPAHSWTAEEFSHHLQVTSSDVSEEDQQQQLAFERAFEEVVVVSEVDHIALHSSSRDWDKEFAEHENWEAQHYNKPPPALTSHRPTFQVELPVRSSIIDNRGEECYEHVTSAAVGQQQPEAGIEINKNNHQHEDTSIAKEWDRLQPDGIPYGYRAIHPNYETYHPMSGNPYLLYQDAIDGVDHPTLADTILALETKIQLDPGDSKTWEQLGLLQQENEHDSAAITCLEKAVFLDPSNCLDAWLALAVSYTNEHCRMDAYNCLEQWIAHSDKYAHILKNEKLGKDYKSQIRRHKYITHLFLEAARTQPGSEEMDPDVQVGLGVLFNMSEEYGKAVDCFKSALMSRPNDYQLWNKVGATLANSRDSHGAIEMYFEALQINPLFVRARYNLAISCMNLGQHREAAEHLLTALELQRDAALSAGEAARQHATIYGGEAVIVNIPNGTSDGIWDSLRLLMYM
jgi:tetratricopeptide (TPR) repeat protein